MYDRQNTPVGRAPNYTTAALLMGLVNLLWILFLCWALWGWAAVMLIAVGVNALIRRLERRRV